MEREIVALGSRVALRYPRESDREGFSELVVASREFLARWAPPAAAEKDPDGSAWFDATLAANKSGQSIKLLVVRQQDDALLGMLSFNEIVRGQFQSAYISYWIGAAFSRQGLMSEALGVGTEFGFRTLELHRLEANIQPDNAPSIALVRKAGFVKEGFSERYLKIGGDWRDHERWALTTEAWEERGRER